MDARGSDDLRDTWATLPQAAELLRVSLSTVTGYCARGLLAYTRLGKTTLVRKDDVERFVKPERGRPKDAQPKPAPFALREWIEDAEFSPKL